MEKKTLGTFLAALRRSSGMTQKQLAEKLNVSDKAISRWERDECAPDLSLIPVIAEIFGITADELLRGQRRNPEESPLPQEEKKNEKQIRHLLNATHSRFQISSLIAGAIAAVGFIAAMICNLGFLRAYLGFFVSLVFYICAGCCEVIFLIQSNAAVRDAEIHQDLLSEYNRAVIRTARITLGSIVFFFAATLPLVIYPWDPYIGLSADHWLLTGAIFGGSSIAATVLTGWIFQNTLAKAGKISLTDADIRRGKLRKKAVRITLFLLAAILILHLGFSALTSATTFVSGRTIETMDEFKNLMEIPLDYEGNGMTVAYDAPISSAEAQEIFICEDGSIIDPDEITEETLIGKDGTVLCSYKPLNQSIVEIHYGDADQGMLPITVYTETDRIQGAAIRDNINSVIILLYVALAVGMTVYYLTKSRKIY